MTPEQRDDVLAHIEWARRRALEYLPADPVQATASLVADLRNHQATELVAHVAGLESLLLLIENAEPADRSDAVDGWIAGVCERLRDIIERD